MKFIVPICIALLMSGCSYFEFNGAMCDQIATEGGTQMQECRNYNEEMAQKATDNVNGKPTTNIKDGVEFKDK